MFADDSSSDNASDDGSDIDNSQDEQPLQSSGKISNDNEMSKAASGGENAAVSLEESAFASVLPDNGINLKDMLSELEINLIRQALDKQNGVTSRAAEMLGMRRTTLVEKMKKYGIVAKDF